MNRLTTLIGALATMALLVGDVNSKELERSKDNREVSVSFLGDKEKAYQINVEAKAPTSFGLHYGGSYSNNNGDNDFLINIGFAGDIKGGKFLLSPYIFRLSSLDFSPGSITQDNISFGLKIGYDLSKRINIGTDLRRINYDDAKFKDDIFSGVFIRIRSN